jgi:hypothetical protein
VRVCLVRHALTTVEKLILILGTILRVLHPISIVPRTARSKMKLKVKGTVYTDYAELDSN